MFPPLLLLLSSIALSTASPLPAINRTASAASNTTTTTTTTTITTPPPQAPISLSLPLPATDLLLTIHSSPGRAPLSTNITPGFLTAASLNLYTYIQTWLPRHGTTRFERVFSFRSQSTGYRIVWWGGEYRDFGINYEDLMEAMEALIRVASGVYEEVELELSHVGPGAGRLRGVAGRIYRDLRTGDGGEGDEGGDGGGGGVDVA